MMGHYCKLCVSTGIVDTEGNCDENLRYAIRYEALSEGDITNTGILSKALNLLSKVAYKRELYTDWAEYMSLLPAVQSRLLGAAVPAPEHNGRAVMG